MSNIATYVINFKDLVKQLSLNSVDVQIDTDGVEAVLNRYFPQLLNVLNKINDVENVDGTAQIKGFATTGEPVRFTADKNILLTGITVSQSKFDENCMDKWNIWLEYNSDKIYIIKDLYSKDTLQHKYFDRFYPVPDGYTVVAQPSNTGESKTFWIDIEYLELD